MAVITGTSGADSLPGTDGADQISGRGGNDTLDGGKQADTLLGGSGNDSLIGGTAADLLNGGGGADTMAGSEGWDTYIVDSVGDVVTEVAAGGTQDEVQSSINYALGANVEHLTLTGSENLRGTGNSGNNTLTGNSGDNDLSGGGGDDVLNGGGGADTLDGGGGSNALNGGGGDDLYKVWSSGDNVTETTGGGFDTVRSGSTYTLPQNVEGLVLTGTNAIDGTGNTADNNITGNANDNVISGGSGNDSLVGGDGIDTLNGGDGDDTLDGGGGGDELNGGAGNDTLDGGEGPETLVGGTGDDLYVCDDTTVAMIEAAGEGIDSMTMTDGLDAPDNIENMTYIGTTNGIGFGANELDNLITGNALSQSMSGNEGIDTISYAYETNAVTVDLENSTATGSGDDSIFGFENALGGAADDTLIGNELGNLLDGGDGLDTLNGGVGVDTMQGGNGSDTYLVDDVNDAVVETDNDPGGLSDGDPVALDDFIDTVIAVVNYTLDNVDFVENLTLGATATQGTGNGLNNVITGNNLGNTLSGLGGTDTLDGGSGNDVLIGGGGADTVSYESSTATGVAVSLLIAGAQATGGSGSDTLSSIERLTGSAFADQLIGSNSANVLRGQGGGDTLSGRGGNDALTGGAGADKFVFNTALNAGTNVDDITDFTGADLMRLDQTVFSGIAPANAALTGAAFTSGAGVTTASQANDRIIYDTSTGDLYYDADGSAAGATATLFATLTSKPAITAADFFIMP